MELAARRFIRWILTLHLALLIVVILIVAAAARGVYHNARDQAIAQAKSTQELLAHQTARGIENYYKAVSSVLELLQPPQEEETGSTTTPAGTTPPGPGGGAGGLPLGVFAPAAPPGSAAPRSNGERQGTSARALQAAAVRKRLAEALWGDINERVSLFFMLDLNPLTRSVPGTPATNPLDFKPVPHDAFGEENGITANDVVAKLGTWFEHIEGANVSSFQIINGIRCNVVAVPMRPLSAHRFLVAVVPLDRIERELLANVNSRATTGAMLVDDQGTVMSHSRSEVIGTSVMTDFTDGRAREVARKYMETGASGTEVFEQPTAVGTVKLDPGIVTIEPIEFAQFGHKRWWVSIASGLHSVDLVVRNLFREAAIWAVFVVISVTGILMSTAFQLIRSRMRLERLKHEILERELTQAREIQLNWLPRDPCTGPCVDVAAVNRPASRISGDFYNWFELPDGRIAIVIGDVTGHGMAAAFLMATTQLLVRGTLMRIGDPGRCLEEVNRQLCSQVFNGQFVTMVLMVVDMQRKTIDLANAGHPAPLLSEGNGFRKVEIEPQLVLGVDADALFPTERISLPGAARLVLYTDGVVDATSSAGKRFRMDGLMSSLTSGSLDSAQSILDAVTGAVDTFRRGEDLSDDLTLVAIHLQPAQTAADWAAGMVQLDVSPA